jgi:hypothetical protein
MIVPDEERWEQVQRMEDRGTFAPAKKAAFVIWWWEDVVDKYVLPVQMRKQKVKKEADKKVQERDNIAALDQEGMLRAREEVQEHDDFTALDNPFPFEQAVKRRNINARHLGLILQFPITSTLYNEREATNTSVVTSILASTQTTC